MIFIEKKIFLFLLIFFLLFLPPLGQSLGMYYTLHISALIGIYLLLILGLNLILGFVGLLDLGFIAFYACGAYLSALLSIRGWNFCLVLPATIILTVLLRLLLGLPALRLRGDYLAIVTLGFGEIMRLVLNNWDGLTNGPKGLPRVGEAISSPKFFFLTFQSDLSFYYLILFFVILGIIVSRRLDNSRIGRAWIAIREDELAAETCGINVDKVKLFAFCFSAIYAATAGVLYTHWIKFISPESFTFWESVLLVSMVVLGGMGSIPGVILATILVIGVPEFLRGLLGTQLVNYRMLFFGLGLVLMVIFRPQGIVPSKRRELELHPSNE
ncbi:MAG TPA: ABC transporter ATP-binding protein [Elusimicrobia bacterium]|jgi:branched-chain amino acid transport system permease protein|nr:ABC transporter ATP-binding protein [Elusimicrobiota bacterium]